MVEVSTIKSVQQVLKNYKQNENKNLYTSQGDSYIAAAIQHADEEHWGLAEHLAEEANKKYELAEDAKLANELQKEDFVVIGHIQNFLPQ